jgi:hypothetical protein
MLKVFCFGKHCSCYLQGEFVLGVLDIEQATDGNWDVKGLIGRTGCYPITRI